MILVRSSRYCEGRVVNLTHLASSRSIWEMGRNHGGVSDKTGRGGIGSERSGHGSMEAVSYMGEVEAVR